ncbi:MAG: flagellar assembly protein FliW [Verrucomicrobiae bacterium]
MQINTTTEPLKQPVAEKAEVTFPAGLIGLPHLTRFQLIADPNIYPLVILRHLGEEQIDFLAVDPSVVLTKYNMVIPDADAEELGLSPVGENPLILNIAIIHPTEPKKVTTNLTAPLIINRQTGAGKQVVLENADSYSAKHELNIEAP